MDNYIHNCNKFTINDLHLFDAYREYANINILPVSLINDFQFLYSCLARIANGDRAIIDKFLLNFCKPLLCSIVHKYYCRQHHLLNVLYLKIYYTVYIIWSDVCIAFSKDAQLLPTNITNFDALDIYKIAPQNTFYAEYLHLVHEHDINTLDSLIDFYAKEYVNNVLVKFNKISYSLSPNILQIIGLINPDCHLAFNVQNTAQHILKKRYLTPLQLIIYFKSNCEVNALRFIGVLNNSDFFKNIIMRKLTENYYHELFDFNYVITTRKNSMRESTTHYVIYAKHKTYGRIVVSQLKILHTNSDHIVSIKNTDSIIDGECAICDKHHTNIYCDIEYLNLCLRNTHDAIVALNCYQVRNFADHIASNHIFRQIQATSNVNVQKLLNQYFELVRDIN